MSPADLHPNLGPGPDPKPICVGCRATDGDVVLVPLHNSSVFICGGCASKATLDVLFEGTRRSCELLLEGAANVTAPLRGAL